MIVTLPEALVRNTQNAPDARGYLNKEKRTWVTYSKRQFFELTETVAHALWQFDVKKGDRVAILANTRFEWAYADMAVLGIGGVTVPIYQSNTADEIQYVINDSQCKVLILENENQIKKWQQIKTECHSVEKIVCIDAFNEKTYSDIIPWDQFLLYGSNRKQTLDDDFTQSCLARSTQDIATIVYTSGTTGEPKGVVLTHKQALSEANELFSALGVTEQDMSLTFLPYAHIMGRVEFWGSVYTGYALAFAESIESIKKNLIEVQPTILVGVPRIFEKIYNGVLTQAESNPLRSKIFKWAISVGRQVSKYVALKKPIPWRLMPSYQLAKRLVFDPFKDKLGGRLRFGIAGGAPLSKEIAEFFHAAGLLVLEGYGLTETTAAIAINTPLEYKFGTVGKPLPDVQIKIATDGEILVKSDKVMQEYYQLPKETEKVFSEGFFATGDIGHLDDEGFLQITDRKKDLIKTAGGKYIAPQRLEGFLKLSQYISNVLIHGDQRKYIVALVTLEQDAVTAYAKEIGLSFSSPEELSSSQAIKELIQQAVAEANSHLSSYESIKKFHILPQDFSIESGELTPSLKVKRKFCDDRYKDIIDSMYGIDKGSM